MRATLIYGAGDVRVEEMPDPVLEAPTDVILRTVRSCVCGSDLHQYHNRSASDPPRPIGHEVLGVVVERGAEVRGIDNGDVAVASFAFQDNTCEFCREGVQISCRHGGFVSGAQAEYVRIPQASGTLVALPVGEDSPLLPSLLTLADVYGTGYHAAHEAGVDERTTVTVIGDGAVGLMSVLSAQLLGAKRIILMGRHKDRVDLGREFGATDVVPERGEEGIAHVRDLTGGDGTHAVLEAVGYREAYDTAVGVVRAGGVISRVGAPQYVDAPIGWDSLFHRNIKLTGGVAPVRAYINRLLPGILDGTTHPGKVFDSTMSLEQVADAYRAMNNRESIKVLLHP